MIEAVLDHLYTLNIPVSKDHFKKSVFSHPDYPSLLAISDSLQRLNIPHKIAKIEQGKLDSLPFPYILRLDIGWGRGELLHISNRSDLKRNKDELDYWKGIVIKAWPVNEIEDEENSKAYSKEQTAKKAIVVLAVVLSGLFVTPLIKGVTVLQFLLLITAILGSIIGGILFAKDVGIKYRPVEIFCNAGKNLNCDRILKTKDAKLFNLFTFSDATLFYFIFQLIVVGIFIPLLNGSFLGILQLMGMLTIPIIIYSLYYQYVKAKTWCVLCLIVDAILVIQVALFITVFSEQGLFLQGRSIFISLFLFLSITLSVILYKQKFKNVNNLIQSETTALRVKHNPTLFIKQLLEEEKVAVTQFEPEMRIGNTQAPIQVLMVLNLHCNPCRIAFEAVQQLVKTYPEKIGFSVRLTKGRDKSIGNIPASSHFIRYWEQHVYEKNESSVTTQNFINAWFETMEPDDFLDRYPNNLEINEYTKILENKHYEWIDKNEIKKTPTFIMNGYQLPNDYRIKDLMAMVPGLAAEIKKVGFDNKVSEEVA